MAAKSYETKVKAYKATCRNMAGLEILNMKFQIACENADSAGAFAARAALSILDSKLDAIRA